MNKSLIQGIGCDIIEIPRIEESIKRHGKHFLDRLFTSKEQQYCQKDANPAPRYAGRFAAKEAIAKALGVGFGKELSFKDIEISNDEIGKPFITLSKKINDRFNHPIIHLSISHSKGNAIAMAIVENH